jgi:uncharacterized protein YkwD
VGIADRDYMREPPPTSGGRGKGIVVILALLVALVGGVRWAQSHRLFGHANAVVLRPAFLPHTPGITLPIPQSPYAADDPWRTWLAPESTCPGGDNASAAQRAQVVVAMCLLNYARARQGLPPLAESSILSAAAARKADDIVRCNDFSHYACGRPPDANARALGLTDRAFGENIFWGPEMYEPPRVAVDQWLNSPEHRENLFNPGWKLQGVAMLEASNFKGAAHGAVWVNEFSAP